MSTLHILSNPTGPVHIQNRIDPFSIAVIKFIKNMSELGWNCIHYGVVGCDVPCETVVCLDEIDQNRAVSTDRYNKKAADEIKKRKHKGDMIMCFHGWENRFAAESNNDLHIVEPSIGYDTKAVWAPYRAFVSYAQMHMFYGERGMLMNPSWYDAVIPNAFSADEFEFNDVKADYILYFGRVIVNKGIDIAIQAADKAGKNLIIAGPGELSELGYNKIPDHVKCVGLCDAVQRKKLMKHAQAIIGPTYYIEPFGNMIAEGYFSGTPAITSDWGGFAETVVQGVTGFRCREFKQFVNAIKNIGDINPKDCYEYAMYNYEEKVVHEQFDDYFKKILTGDFYRI